MSPSVTRRKSCEAITLEERLEMRYEDQGIERTCVQLLCLTDREEDTGTQERKRGRGGDRVWRRQQRKRSGACVA